MAGSLKKINQTSASGNPSTIQVTGIDTTFDVYALFFKNCVPSSDDRLGIRLTKSGTIQTDSNYDNARMGMPTGASFQNNEDENDSKILLGTTESTGNGAFGVLYLFNFSTSDEFSFITLETEMFASTPALFGEFGGGVHTVASASDGISFFYESGSTFGSGQMTLYGIAK